MTKEMIDKRLKVGTQKDQMTSDDLAQISRDNLHMKTHMRQVAIERALINKGLLSREDVEKEMISVVQDVAKEVASSLGIDLDELKSQGNK